MADQQKLPSADDPVRRLEDEVALRRERLTTTLRSLRSGIDEVSEWRHWYERYPTSFLLGAAVLGWTVARFLPPSRS
jgi:hypothetical protein